MAEQWCPNSRAAGRDALPTVKLTPGIRRVIAYDAIADARSWRAMRNLFEDVFGQAG